MMKRKNGINRISCAVLLLLLCLLVSCGPSYRSDVGAQALADEVISTLSEQDGEYYAADGETYDIYFGEDAAYGNVQDGCIVYHSEGTNVDQFGIFRVKEGQSTEPVRRMIQEYADGQASYLHSFASNYNQGELDKIQNVQVSVMGQYVFFSILSDADESAATDAIKAMIEQ